MVEDLNEEIAVGIGGYGEFRHPGIFPGGRRVFQVRRGGKIELELGGCGIDLALDDGDELEVLRAYAFEELVDLDRVLDGFGVDAGEGVELDLVFAEDVEAADDLLVGVAAFLVDAVGVVQVFRAVDGEPDEEIVFREEFAPLVVEQGAVGLECGADLLAVGVFLLEFNDFAEVAHAEQGGLAALEGEAHFLSGLGGYVVADEGLEAFLRHLPLLVPGIELLLLQVEAVFAIEVADRPDRLGHDVEGLRGGRHSAWSRVRSGKAGAFRPQP